MSLVVLTAKYQALFAKIEDILSLNPEALNFVKAYNQYAHLVDDVVDEVKSVDLVDKLTDRSAALYSSNYWSKNGRELYLVEQVIHLVYFNSVKWERSNVLWKQRDAKALSHCGYMMLFAVLLLETQNQALVQSLALEFMEKCHLEHLHDLKPEVLNA